MKVSFTTHSSSIEEVFKASEPPEQVTQKLALQKAEDVSQKYAEAVVIGADTVVALENKILGKPSSKRDAEKTLRDLSRRTHKVITGVALVKTDKRAAIIKKKLFYEKTSVTFGKLTSSMIKRYADTGKPMDKAGGYGIQDEWGAIFTERIEGDFYNVMGLPLHSLFHQLTSFTPNIFHL